MTGYWQEFSPKAPPQTVWRDHYDAPMPDGTTLRLPLRDLGETAIAGLIANQAAFPVLDRLAAWTAEAAAPLAPGIVVGLPTLGHTVGAAVARALGHPNWVAPSTTRKRWYDDTLSAPLSSITSPATGPNATRRMWLDPRLRPRLQGRRVVLVDDVISTGTSALAGLALLRTAGVEPVGLLVAMIQGQRWRERWDPAIPVRAAFTTPLFRRVEGGFAPIQE